MDTNRRTFLKSLGLTGLPLLTWPDWAEGKSPDIPPASGTEKTKIHFTSDGMSFTPSEYAQKITEINAAQSIAPDMYGAGGSTKALEEAYARITGKQKAIFMPTGTMANQIALKLLSGSNAKVFVPENSHIYRDEGDAAQTVHNKRLIPVGKDKPFFTMSDLQETISYYDGGEVFKSGMGAVAVECPVRRAAGAASPISVIKEISTYCKSNQLKLHLDGARIHIASAYTGVSIAEYSSYFDTVYISLYKYLNAPFGAILCGDAAFIEQIPHQVKIHGGTLYQTWAGTSIALHYLNGLEERWKKVVATMEKLVPALNKSGGMTVTKVENGTNVYFVDFNTKVNQSELMKILENEHSIRFNTRGILANETVLNRKPDEIAAAFDDALKKAGA